MGKLYIFDADNALRRCTVPGQPCPNAPDQWLPIAPAYHRLRQIDWRDNHFAIASNQGGVAKGHLTKDVARGMLDDLAHVMAPRAPHTIAMCIHASDAGCACRKPMPGLLNAIMAYHKMPKSQTLFVGDMDTDEMAAQAAGVDFAWIWDFCNLTRDDWRTVVGNL